MRQILKLGSALVACSMLLALSAGLVAAPPDAVRPKYTCSIKINEVKALDTEFVELYNTSSYDIDLSHYTLSDGEDTDDIVDYTGTFDFGLDGTVIPAGGYAVVVNSSYSSYGTFNDFLYTYADPANVIMVTVDDGTIGNGLLSSDDITIRSKLLVQVQHSYSWSSSGWDSLERYVRYLYNPSTGTVAESDWWRVCINSYGSSPGAANIYGSSAYANVVAPELMLNEVMAHADIDDSAAQHRNEFVEIYNPNNVWVSLNVWYINSEPGTSINDPIEEDFTAWYDWGLDGTVIPPGGYAIVVDPEYQGEYNDYLNTNADPNMVIMVTVDDAAIGSNGLEDTSGTVYLYYHSTLIDTFSWTTDSGAGISWELKGSGTWGLCTDSNGSTPGVQNSA